jgi:hypothetical protein
VLVTAPSKTTLSLSRLITFSWQRVTATVTVDSAAEAPPTGDVTITVGGRQFTAQLVDGRASIQLPRLGGGLYALRASYSGDETTTGSTSGSKLLWVVI